MHEITFKSLFVKYVASQKYVLEDKNEGKWKTYFLLSNCRIACRINLSHFLKISVVRRFTAFRICFPRFFIRGFGNSLLRRFAYSTRRSSVCRSKFLSVILIIGIAAIYIRRRSTPLHMLIPRSQRQISFSIIWMRSSVFLIIGKRKKGGRLNV